MFTNLRSINFINWGQYCRWSACESIKACAMKKSEICISGSQHLVWNLCNNIKADLDDDTLENRVNYFPPFYFPLHNRS